MTGPTGKFKHVTAGKDNHWHKKSPAWKGQHQLCRECHLSQARDHASRFNNCTNYLSPLKLTEYSKFRVSKKCMETHQTTVPDTSANELNLRKMTEGRDFALIPDRFDTYICPSFPCLPASRHRKGLD